MKTTLTAVLIVGLIGCGYSEPDYDEPISVIISKLPKKTDKTLCGLYEFPHEYSPVDCGANPWTRKGVCCTWTTEEYYSECSTIWCLDELTCAWHINRRDCSPI